MDDLAQNELAQMALLLHNAPSNVNHFKVSSRWFLREIGA